MQKNKGGIILRKLLSVLLTLCMMIALCTAFAAVPASAAAFLSDEYDATANGFTITVKDKRGLNAAYFDPSMDYETVQYLYENGYADHDSYGIHRVLKNDDGTYVIDPASGGVGLVVTDPSRILAKTDKSAPHYGGYYHSGKNTSLPVNQFPINVDIHLGDTPVTTSGVRIYPRQDSPTQGGGIRKFEVYVKFNSDDEWHYLYTDGRSKDKGADEGSTINSAFGYNAALTDIRIRVTDTYANVGLDGLFAAKGTAGYVNFGWITVLKPYNAGGPIVAATPKTVTSFDETDEMDVPIVKYGYENTGVKKDVRLVADNDRMSGAQLNGSMVMDFGKNITISGFRYYPMRGQVGLYGFKNKKDGTGYGGVIYGPEYGVIQVDSDHVATYSGDKGEDLALKADSAKLFNYPTVNGEVDYTMPVTVLFDRNYTVGGLTLAGWAQTDGTAGNAMMGEIKLLKADTTNDKYLDGTLLWDETPSVTSVASNSGTANAGKDRALFDRVVLTSYSNADDAYIYRGFNYAGLNSGETVTMTIDLKKAYTFSAVRVVAKYAQPDQALTRAILSVSDDGENWADSYVYMDSKNGVIDEGRKLIKYTSTGSFYTDVAARTFEKNYNVTARFVKLTVLKTSGAHLSMQEIALVEPKANNATLSVADFAGAAVDTRVPGSVENVKTIETANKFLGDMTGTYSSALEEAKAALGAATVTESTKASFGTATGTTDHKKGDGCVPTETTKTDASPSISLGTLTDGFISAMTDVGSDYIARADFSVFPNPNGEKFRISIPLDETDSFTGIRFYSRKGDWNTAYNLGNCAKNVTVTLYGADGTTSVTTALLTATTGKQYTTESDIMYTDIALTFNGEGVRLTDVSKLDVDIVMNFGGEKGGNNHWGAEEIRLLNDETVANEKTVAGLSEYLHDEEMKNSVKLEIVSAESGIYEAEEEGADGTGIIRFITRFNAIKEGTAITEFGTYVITKGNYEANSELSGYSEAFASYTGATPNVGDTYSVDVTDIAKINWNKPVVAISFAKIEGYDNIIVSAVKHLDGVNADYVLSKATVTE